MCIHIRITCTKHNTCTHLPQIHTHTPPSTLHRSSESGALPLPGGLVSADKYFKPFELACKSNVPRIINTALDCIQASLFPPPPPPLFVFKLIYLYSYCSYLLATPLIIQAHKPPSNLEKKCSSTSCVLIVWFPCPVVHAISHDNFQFCCTNGMVMVHMLTTHVHAVCNLSKVLLMW